MDIDMEKGKTETEAQAICLNPFTVCFLCKRKFVICLFADEETNKSYPFAKGLNGLKELPIYYHMIVSVGQSYSELVTFRSNFGGSNRISTLPPKK